jgi:aldehyde dehydrogenase (NAD+)
MSELRPKGSSSPWKQTTATAMQMLNHINGKWVPSKTGQVSENRNPADNDDLVCTFPESSTQDVDDAVAAAKKAYKSWRLLPAPRRAEYLFKVGAILARDKENLARDMTREMGKVLAETRGDVQEESTTAYLAGGEGRRLFGDAVPCELPNKAGWSERHPIGVAGLIRRGTFPWRFRPGSFSRHWCAAIPPYLSRRRTRRSRPTTWSRRARKRGFPKAW